jgi:hypothetical protein
MVQTKLIDRRNYQVELPVLLEQMSKATFVGIDVETEDSRRHQGLNLAMKIDEEGFKAKNKRLIVNFRRELTL